MALLHCGEDALRRNATVPYELGVDETVGLRVMAAFDELALAV
jgi:hypothetical protein